MSTDTWHVNQLASFSLHIQKWDFTPFARLSNFQHNSLPWEIHWGKLKKNDGWYIFTQISFDLTFFLKTTLNYILNYFLIHLFSTFIWCRVGWKWRTLLHPGGQKDALQWSWGVKRFLYSGAADYSPPIFKCWFIFEVVGC